MLIRQALLGLLQFLSIFNWKTSKIIIWCLISHLVVHACTFIIIYNTRSQPNILVVPLSGEKKMFTPYLNTIDLSSSWQYFKEADCQKSPYEGMLINYIFSHYSVTIPYYCCRGSLPSFLSFLWKPLSKHNDMLTVVRHYLPESIISLIGLQNLGL